MKAKKPSKSKSRTQSPRPVLVTDIHRGIYFGYLLEFKEDIGVVRLENARHCWYFNCAGGEQSGPYSLATHGPEEGSKIGPPCTMTIRDVSKVVDVSRRAAERWVSLGWGV